MTTKLRPSVRLRGARTCGVAGRSIVLVSYAARLFGQAGEIIRLDPKLDEIVASDARVEKLADGFGFVEGPVWDRGGGYLLFSDIPANVINKWTPDRKVSVLVKPSGFTGTDPSEAGSQNNNGKEVVTLIGSNGLTLDRQGRIVLAAHGDRAIVRIEKNGQRTVLAERYDGKQLNSPNDLVYKADGALYFTDPLCLPKILCSPRVSRRTAKSQAVCSPH